MSKECVFVGGKNLGRGTKLIGSAALGQPEGFRHSKHCVTNSNFFHPHVDYIQRVSHTSNSKSFEGTRFQADYLKCLKILPF